MSHNSENSANSSNSSIVKALLAAGALWRGKWIIALGTTIFTLGGVAYSLMASPVFVSRAVIYPQDVTAGTERGLSVGGLGAVLNPLQGTSYLNRMEVILRSRHLARETIVRNDLLPVLFPRHWDAEKKAWRVPKEERPGLDHGIAILQKSLAVRVDGYRMTLDLEARAGSPILANRILEAYLATLNARAKENVVQNAEANRAFLEQQMDRIADPWMREKMQQLVIREIENAMLLNANAFELLEAPEVPNMRQWPKRKRIVLASAFAGFLLSCLGVLILQASQGLRADLRRG